MDNIHALRLDSHFQLRSRSGQIQQITNWKLLPSAEALGCPIASGPVEGACKNLIKDRMERSGMRWTPSMAEAIVKLRSLYLSGDFDDYWPFHVAQDQLQIS